MEAARRCLFPMAAYAQFFARHAWQTATHMHSPCPDGEDWLWWQEWSADERATFFHALGIHSRLRPDLVARDIRTRSVIEVCVAIRHFDRLVRRMKRVERRMYESKSERRRQTLARIPAARQIPDSLLACEEAHATALADKEPAPLQMHRVAMYLYPSAEAPTSEPLSDVVSRLVTPSSDGGVSMIPAYQDLPGVPRLVTESDVQKLLQRLEAHHFLHTDPSHVHWHVATCHPSHAAHAALEDVVSCPSLDGVVRETLAQMLYGFLVHVMYELCVVGERTHARATVDAAFVWTTVARLGYVHDDGFQPDLMDVMARKRAVSDPPMAWQEAQDDSDTASPSSSDSDASYESESLDEDDYVADAAPIGSMATLRPYEKHEPPMHWSPLEAPTALPATDDVIDASSLDADVDAWDTADDERYILRLQRDWPMMCARDAESAAP